MNDAFRPVCGRAYPFNRNNIDTDMILPASYMKTVSRDGLADGCFASLRADKETVFDDPEFAGAPILIAGANFGCGSSREHAVWALIGFGIKAIIAPSFGEIFEGNAFRNGLLTIALDQHRVDALSNHAHRCPFYVDLETQIIDYGGSDPIAFDIDPSRKQFLLQGLDEIAITLADGAAISAFELAQSGARHCPAPKWAGGAEHVAL